MRRNLSEDAARRKRVLAAASPLLGQYMSLYSTDSQAVDSARHMAERIVCITDNPEHDAAMVEYVIAKLRAGFEDADYILSDARHTVRLLNADIEMLS